MLAKHEIKPAVWSVLNLQFTPNQEISDVSKLTAEEIYKHFDKEGVTEQEIKDALEQLVKEKSVEKKWISFEIYYPKDKAFSIPKDAVKFFSVPSVIQVVFGYYVLLILVSVPSINVLLSTFYKFEKIEQIIAFGLVLSVISIYITSSIFNFLKRNRTALDTISNVLKQNSPTINAILFTFLFLALVIYIPLLIITHVDVEIANILELIGLSVAIGLGLDYQKTKKSKLEPV